MEVLTRPTQLAHGEWLYYCMIAVKDFASMDAVVAEFLMIPLITFSVEQRHWTPSVSRLLHNSFADYGWCNANSHLEAFQFAFFMILSQPLVVRLVLPLQPIIVCL